MQKDLELNKISQKLSDQVIQEPSHSNIGLGMFLALFFHSIMEGLATGLAADIGSTVAFFVAILGHK